MPLRRGHRQMSCNRRTLVQAAIDCTTRIRPQAKWIHLPHFQHAKRPEGALLTSGACSKQEPARCKTLVNQKCGQNTCLIPQALDLGCHTPTLARHATPQVNALRMALLPTQRLQYSLPGMYNLRCSSAPL